MAIFKKKPGGEAEKKEKKKKSQLREWLDALLFAGIAALIIRSFFLEPYMIPSASMERSLMVGDFLFVSKLHYGPRLPMAPLSIPFLHNKIPGTNAKSYLDWITLPYMRIPGFVDVERNDVVVFNYPADDQKPNNPELGPIRVPSMKENYIKRCVAQAGDKFEIRNRQIYINEKPEPQPETIQFEYRIHTNGNALNPKKMEELGFRQQYENQNLSKENQNTYIAHLTEELKQKLGKFDEVVKIEPLSHGKLPPQSNLQSHNFGFDMSRYGWTLDDFGPIVIPGEGQTIKLDRDNIEIYRRAIDVYEDNELEMRGDDIYINGEKTDQYTFGMNYYFVMGDNRHDSQDSRYWGFVPEDHIVGKPMFVFFSSENGVRWERLFMGID